MLLNTGKVDVNSKDQSGQTPLSLAAGNRHEAVVEMLVDTDKVAIESKDLNGWTPLWWAVQNRNKAIVRMLLDKGGSISQTRDG